jgi:hypothetical protein
VNTFLGISTNPVFVSFSNIPVPNKKVPGLGYNPEPYILLVRPAGLKLRHPDSLEAEVPINKHLWHKWKQPITQRHKVLIEKLK